MRISIIPTAVLLTGCATASAVDTTNWKYAPHALSESQVAAVHMAISNTLKDPESAKFSDFKARKVIMPGNKIAYRVCGYVNAKNSFGGYTGRSPFLGTFPWSAPDKFVVNAVGQGPMTDSVFYACSGLGLALS